MVTPKSGVFDSLPLNAEGRKVGLAWDPAKDEAAGEACRAYTAANVMRGSVDAKRGRASATLLSRRANRCATAACQRPSFEPKW